jgi:hypothetical protein
MTIQIDIKTTPDKRIIDDLERDLLAKGFSRVSPTAKKIPGQYSRSESHWAEGSFEEVPMKYSIEWCYEK